MPSSIVNQEAHINAQSAIPGSGEEPMTCSAIYRRQATPRMSRVSLRCLLDELVRVGRVEVVLSTPHKYYRRAPEISVASGAVTGYTQSRRCESSLPGADDPLLRTVFPLRAGKPVKLWLDLPTTLKKSTAPRRRLVILSPGSHVGLPRTCVLVSIVGSGSCVVRTSPPHKLADLVLAGMPAKLAGELMNKIHRALEQS